MTTVHSNPAEITWDTPPPATRGATSQTTFDQLCEALEANAGQTCLYREGGNSYWSMSDAQVERHPHIKVENRRMQDGTVSTWLTFDAEYNRPGKAAASAEGEGAPAKRSRKPKASDTPEVVTE